mmetsp:Transcript_31488/g.53165  ORF Transcript_31488/g.53165 Transcript_31488/m.53165 type:complete len:481 (-) Transcript_31488:1047-2489(-)
MADLSDEALERAADKRLKDLQLEAERVIAGIGKDAPVSRVARSAWELLNKAKQAEKEKNTEIQYVMLWRFTTLVVDKMQKLKGYGDVSFSLEKKQFQKEAFTATERLGWLKTHLRVSFVEEERVARSKYIAPVPVPSPNVAPPVLPLVPVDPVPPLLHGSSVQPQPEAFSQAPIDSSSSEQPTAGTPSAPPPPLASALSPYSGSLPTSPTSPYSSSNQDLQRNTSFDELSQFPSGTPTTSISSNPFMLGPPPSSSLYNFDLNSSMGIEKENRSNRGRQPGRLREMDVPVQLIEQFEALASENTSRNVETCGILSGFEYDGRFAVTAVIVPQQTGNADSCSASHEEQVLQVLSNQNLITLGWIHTHPRQTAFLSSVDLHTHCGYQSMLPEAIAIVIAPTDVNQRVAVFSLSTPLGVSLVQDCTKAGFHTHSAPGPLFVPSSHVHILSSTDMAPLVFDLRKGLPSYSNPFGGLPPMNGGTWS